MKYNIKLNNVKYLKIKQGYIVSRFSSDYKEYNDFDYKQYNLIIDKLFPNLMNLGLEFIHFGTNDYLCKYILGKHNTPNFLIHVNIKN